ncbi:MAG: hypothetical protein IKU43_02710 [Clostridia bacterium]|nr:hypothetical protein [Clostridia bacterium]
MKKLLSAILSVLMIASCMSFVAFAEGADEDANLAALDPIELPITAAAAKDQKCTCARITDEFGRSVQKITPDNSVATTAMAPACFVDNVGSTIKSTVTASGYAYKTIKVVYYTSGSSANKPTMSVFVDDGVKWSSTSRSVTSISSPAQAGKWQTAIFQMPDTCNTYPIHAYMFYVFGNDSVNNHMGETIYIGYVGLFDTVENAQAHKSNFEGDVEISAIKVGGTAIAGFDKATTSYTYDLAGAMTLPAVTVNAKGDTNNLKITTTSLDEDGKATATIKAGDTTYTVNLTGGPAKTSKTPITFTLSRAYSGASQGSKGSASTDEYGRAIHVRTPVTDSTNKIYPGGDFPENTNGYRILKFVYRTSESTVPTISANAVKSDSGWLQCRDGDGTPIYDKTPEAGKWNVVYFPIKDMQDPTNNNATISIKYWQINMSAKKASELPADSYYQIGYLGLFGSIVDAREHKSAFEGDLNITDVKLGGTSYGNDEEITVDLAGSDVIPALTITATGNTNDVVITNGTLSEEGTATSTVKNGSETVITVSFTGGPVRVDPVETITNWASPNAQRCTTSGEVADEFGRKSRTFYAENQYYDGGDKTATGTVSPGGDVVAAGETKNHKVFKLVYKSDSTTVPTLSAFILNGSTKTLTNTSGATSLEAGKWHTLYYNYGTHGALNMYMINFTTDDVANHIGEEYTIGYSAVFGSLEEAQAHKSAFEGDFTITDVLLDGTSIGNVTTYSRDLDGGVNVPVLTIKATGNTDGVVITNGTMDSDGNATSKVMVNGVDKVVVSFTGGSNGFAVSDILVNGVSIGNFSKKTTAYTVKLPYASKAPTVTYTYEGSEKEVAVETTTQNGDYITTISYDDEVKYTVTFDVDDTKPTALLNTLYKIKSGEQVTVGYFGGSVTGGTGSTNANSLSWRGLSRDWLRDTYAAYNTNIVERKASVGGTGSIYGIYRADRHFIMDKAPDLCFIEMAVNDSYDGGVYETNANYVYAESIVKKIYASNPKADIIFILTGDYSKLKAEITSDTPVFGKVYTELGAYYNIPCLYLGRELVRDKFMGNYPSSSSADAWKVYFGDIVHPTDAGYAYYGKVINDYLKFNLPIDYTPTASEYADKVLPEKSYCEVNGKGRLIDDAYTVAGNEIKKSDGTLAQNGDAELGGYTSITKGEYRPFYSDKADTVTTLKFKAADIGAWAWAYNNEGGTTITYSIDGGAKQTRNFYLSSSNHRWHLFATDLDPEVEHTLRIYHEDANKLELYYFFLSGLSDNIKEEEMGIRLAPLADVFAKDDDGKNLFDVKIKEANGTYREFTFYPAKSKYAIIMPEASLSADGLPEIEVSVPEGYYGYEVVQATAENKTAYFAIDNVKTFEFAFMTEEEAKDYDEAELITKLEAPAKKLWSIVEGQTVNAPTTGASATNIQGLTLTPVWEGADGFSFGDVAVGNELIAYTATYTAPDGFMFAPSIASSIENATVSADYSKLTIKLYTYIIPKDAIYIDDEGSNSTDDYAEGNLQKPYKTIDHAMSLLDAKGGGVIVVVNKVTETNSGKPGASLLRSGDFVIMGWDEESVLETTRHYNLRADTTIRDINLWMSQQWGGIYLNGYALTLGDKNYTDLIVTATVSDAAQILMASDGGTYGETGKLTINSGKFSLVVGSGYGKTTITGDVDIEVNGGEIATFIAGLHCGNATGVHTLTGDINFTMNGGSITALTLGSANGMYLHDGNFNAVINGGTIKNIAFRTGNADKELNGEKYPQQLGDYTLKINGGTITGSISDTSNGTTGVLGYTMIDLLDYNGDREAVLAKINKAQFDEIRYQVIYVDATKGASANDGLTKDTAVATLTDAFNKFAGGLAGKIVLVGEVPTHEYDSAQSKYTTNLATDKAGRGHVTITGYDESSKFVFCKSTTLAGPTTFENIHIQNNGAYSNLFAGGYKLVMGKGITNSTTVSHELQIGNGSSGANLASGEIEIHSGTYGLIYTGADFNGGSVDGDTVLTIYGGTFKTEIYAGGYVATNKQALAGTADAGKIGGKIGLYIHGGTFNKNIFLGGNQFDTVGSLEAKITGGTFNGSLFVGARAASGTYTPTGGTAVAYTTDVLGDAIVEITGGSFTGKVVHDVGEIKGKSVIIVSNGVTAGISAPETFTYAVTASEKGTTTYDAASDKFSLVPINSTMDIFVNDNKLTKASDNLYTLSGASNNLYDIKYGGETALNAKFIITQPIAELTPVSEVILTGGKNTYNEIGNCTASKVTWEPAHTRFQFDTQYTATVTLTALAGIEFSDNLEGLNVNGKYSGNVVNATFNEDHTAVTVKVTFPKTEKSDLVKLAETETTVKVTFETIRGGDDSENFKPTTVTLTNVENDAYSVSGTATENGTEGSFTANVKSGLYNVTVKKQGYLEATAEGILVSSNDEFAIDLGKLIAGDVIDGNGNVAGDGIIDIDDLVVALRGLNPDASAEVRSAADINESGIINVTQLGSIKAGFGKTAEEDSSDYNGYFENTYYKLTVDKKLTVGYIGGSIIQGAGVETAGDEKYTDRMHKWFQTNFPEAEIHTINAGISNTGSNFANFRLEEDLMLRDEGYIPDLVFLEFCVNDFNTYGQDHIEMLYESLIKNVYEINPNADIVCLLTALSGYATSKAAHIKVAEYYDIPVLDVGTPMSAGYTIAGDCKIFTNDQLHPNGMGYELYAKLTKNLLEKYIIYATPENPKYNAKVLPEQLQAQLLTNANEISVADASVVKTGSWTTGTISTGSRIFQADKNAPFISSSTAGDTFEFTFNGDAFGFLVRKSAAMGTFEFSIDGGAWIECNAGTSQATYTHCQTYMPGTVTADCTIPAGEHKVVVRVTGKKCVESCTGCEVSIIGIFYNGAE